MAGPFQAVGLAASRVSLAGTGHVDQVVAVRGDSPQRDLPTLMAAASERPDQIVCAANLGAPSHFAGFLGILATIPGTSPATGEARWTLGFSELDDGFRLLPVLIGLFAINQVIRDLVTSDRQPERVERTAGSIRVGWQDWWPHRKNLVRSSLIGTWVGILPGVGANVGSVLAYSAARAASPNPERFGQGSEEGVVASEAANNATVGGALIPLIAMGIPGSVIDAILLGALVIHGLQPGPMLMSQDPAAVHATIGAFGNPHVRTPTLDGLVGDGVAFTHAYCQSPICTPSRSSFMTGMYPSRVHNTRNGNETFPPFPPVITKPIAESGYDCGLVGKFHLQSAGRRTDPRLDDGFGYWKFSHAPRDDWAEGHDYADWVKAKGGDLDAMRADEARVPPEFHQTTWASERAIEFLRRPRPAGQPWLLNVNVYDPHPPFIPPKVYADRFDPGSMPGPHFRESDHEQQAKLARLDFQDQWKTPEERDARRVQALYYAMIAQIDDQLARILEELERSGQRDNTVVIFTSDHGETLGDHGLMFKGCRFYEGLVRVPLIIAWPGEFRAGVRGTGLVELLDLTSTIVELTGVSAPDYLQGQSLVPLLRGEVEPERGREFVRSEYFDALDPHFTGGTGTFGTMYRTPRYKLCLYHNKGLGELYDMENDPWEFDDLWDAPEHRAIKQRLIREAFDAHVVLTTDMGSRRIAPM